MNDYAMPSSNEHKPTLIIMNHTSPIYEYERHEGDLDDYHQDQYVSSSPIPPCGVGGSFGLFLFTSCAWGQNHDSDSDYECKYLLHQGGWHKDTTWWWRKQLNKAKEYTQVLGGSKWKTIIRKIAGYCKTSKQKQNRLSKKQKQRNTRFQYDLHSYALNFDGGVAREGDYAALDFAAARFAAHLSNKHCSIGRLIHETTHESASIESKL